MVWKPVLVGGIFNAVNPSVYESRERGVPAKQAYLKKDLQDWARHEGVDIRFPPSIFPVNSVKAMRACCWLLSQGPAAQGMDAAALLAAMATPEVKAQLKANTDEVIARGGFGSPTFFVGGSDMYFGNDRLPLVRAAVLRQRAQA